MPSAGTRRQWALGNAWRRRRGCISHGPCGLGRLTRSASGPLDGGSAGLGRAHPALSQDPYELEADFVESTKLRGSNDRHAALLQTMNQASFGVPGKVLSLSRPV